MSEKNTGGPAFPTQTYEYDGPGNVLQYQEQGMTLRDYFAAKANDSDIEQYMWEIDESRTSAFVLIKEQIRTREAAKFAYADAMLKARES